MVMLPWLYVAMLNRTGLVLIWLRTEVYIKEFVQCSCDGLLRIMGTSLGCDQSRINKPYDTFWTQKEVIA